MNNYVLVQDEQIVDGPRSLPSVWRNVSGLDLFSDEQLRSYGWYPCTFSPYAGSMDDVIITGSYFVKEGNQYVQYQSVRSKTQNEIDQENESLWVNIRIRRNLLLTESDWTQLPDVPLSTEKVEEWKGYRQKLRDITDASNPHAIAWPDPPQ